MKKISLLLLVVSLAFVSAQAQQRTNLRLRHKRKPDEKKVDWSFSAAFKNRHLWRCGQGFNGFTIQSTVSCNFPSVSVGAWGAFELDAASPGEVDLFVEADFLKYFTIGVYDFYFPNDEGGRKMRDFSKIEDSPNHMVDAFLSYGGTERFPLGALVGGYVYGIGDQDADGNQKYSTYLELNYTFTLTETSGVYLYVGATTSNTSAFAAKKPIYALNAANEKEPTGEYGPATESEFNVIGFGTRYTKSFKIGQFYANASSEFLYNPNIDGLYVAFATNISF